VPTTSADPAPSVAAPAASPTSLTRLLLAVGVGTAAWCALGIAAPATFGAHVAVDEPQYLLSATSLAEDLDLDIADELAAERWRTYHEAALPEQTALLDGGRRISPHDPLLPVLLALPVAVGGWIGAKLAMAAMAGALAAGLVWTAVRRLGVAPRVAAASVLCFTLAPPMAVYGSQVYPELPGALAVAAAVAAVTGPLRRSGTLLLGVAVSALPWLSVKYAPVAAALTVAALWRLVALDRWRTAGALVAGLGRVRRRLRRRPPRRVRRPHPVRHRRPLRRRPAGRDRHRTELVGQEPAAPGPARRPRLRARALAAGVAAGRGGPRRPGPPSPTVVAGPRAPLAAGWATATFVALTMHGFWWPGRQVVVVLPLAVLAVAWWASSGGAPSRALVLAGLGAGALAFATLVVEGITGRTTWVVAFEATSDPLVRVLRPLLPDLRAMGPADVALLVAWGAATAALAAVGWRGAARSATVPTRRPPTAPTAPTRHRPTDHRPTHHQRNP
jgi:hypothetical protein